MNVYLDTSVILRRLFGQPTSLENWGEWKLAYTSELTRVEALRTIDRLRLQGQMLDAEVAFCVMGLQKILDRLGEIHLDQNILYRASQAYPTIIRTLDAIHLASALLWKELYEKDILFLTHDIQLGHAAQAMSLKTSGF